MIDWAIEASLKNRVLVIALFALLAGWGLASAEDVAACEVPPGPANYEEVIPRKRELLRRALKHLEADDSPGRRLEFREWRVGRHWLDDFALFMAIKEAHDGRPWWDWPEPLAKRDPAALKDAADEFEPEIDAHRFGQFLFDRQWAALKKFCATAPTRTGSG